MEHSEVGSRSMAVKPKSGVGLRITGQILRGDGVAESVRLTGLVNRTAVVRDPYARWCGRGEAARPLPIPIR